MNRLNSVKTRGFNVPVWFFVFYLPQVLLENFEILANFHPSSLEICDKSHLLAVSPVLGYWLMTCWPACEMTDRSGSWHDLTWRLIIGIIPSTKSLQDLYIFKHKTCMYFPKEIVKWYLFGCLLFICLCLCKLIKSFSKCRILQFSVVKRL